MDAIVLVESPLQLLNALEAIFYFKIKEYQIIIRLSGHAQSDNQLLNTVNLLSIDPIKIKLIKVSAQQRTLFDLIKIITYSFRYIFSKVKYVFVGNLDSGFFRSMVKQFDRKNIVYLDDGAKTIIFNHSGINASKIFFSVFNFPSSINSDNIINNYEYLKKEILKQNIKIEKNKIFLLGQKLSEIGIVSEKLYLDLVLQVTRKYPNSRISYIPHRGESFQKIEAISKLSNITIMMLDYPVELYGLYNKEIPYKVISFYSTALYTMSVIYGIKSEAIKFNKLNPEIELIYDFYQASNLIESVTEFET